MYSTAGLGFSRGIVVLCRFWTGAIAPSLPPGACLAPEVGHQRLHQPVDVVPLGLDVGLAARARAAPRSSPARCSRGARPRPSRSPAGIEEERDRRRRGERHVVGALERPRAAASSSGSATVSYSATHVDLGAARAQRVGQHVAGLGRARHQRPPDRHVRQRLDQALGDEPLGHDVGGHAVLAQRRAPCRGRSPRPGRPAKRPGVAAGRRQPLEQQPARRWGWSGRRGRSRRARARHRRAATIRIAGASTTSAPSARSRAARPLACARARVTATLTPCSGRRSSQCEPLAQRRDRTEHRDRRRPDPPRPRPRGDRRERRRRPRAGPGSVPRWTTRRGLVRGAAAGDQPLRDRLELADAHVDDQRPGERRQRRPVERRLGLRRDPRGRSRTRPRWRHRGG